MTFSLQEGKSARPTEPLDAVRLLARVRAVVGTLDLDCVCRSKLIAALEQFENLETRRQLRTMLLDARHQAERISALLELIGELDTVESDETDLGVFEEITLLFQDVESAAQLGAADMTKARSLAAVRGVAQAGRGA